MKHIYILLSLLIFNNIIVNAQATDYITGLDGPNRLYINGTDLFYCEWGSDVISKVDLTFNTPIPTVFASGFNRVVGLTVYGTDLYISDTAELASSTDGKLFKIDLTDSNAELIEVVTGYDIDYSVLHQNYLFFSRGQQGVFKIDLTETNPVRTSIISEASHRFFGLAIYGNDLYYSSTPTTGSNFKISKIDITDNSATPIVVLDSSSEYINPIGLRVIGDNLYLLDFSGDKIFKADLTEDILSLTELVSNVDGVKDCIDFDSTLYIAEGYGNKISKLDNFGLSTEEFTVRDQIKIYPNPVKDYFYISNLSSATNFKILTQIGQIVMQGKVTPNESINVSDLANGLYLIVLNNGSTKKFIKK